MVDTYTKTILTVITDALILPVPFVTWCLRSVPR